jgi:hypothetical protein
MMVKLIGLFAFILMIQMQSFSQIKKVKKEVLVYAKKGEGNKTLNTNLGDSLAKMPKTRGNSYVTLCFRNDTNQFVDVWNGNYYWGRLSPNGWSASPTCFYINNNYYTRDWTAKTSDEKYYWTFTRTTYNDDVLVIHW